MTNKLQRVLNRGFRLDIDQLKQAGQTGEVGGQVRPAGLEDKLEMLAAKVKFCVGYIDTHITEVNVRWNTLPRTTPPCTPAATAWPPPTGCWSLRYGS